MILSICPNPSIDCTIELDYLNVGKLNRIDNKVETYSGKALNVAIGVARLGEESLATGFMFDNHKRMFEHALSQDNVKYSFVYNKGNARTNYKIIDKKAMLTEINDKGEEVSLAKQQELIDRVAFLSQNVDIAVMSGSLPKGVPHEYYGDVVKAIPDNVKVIIDAEADNTKAAMFSREIHMVKPNLTELEVYAGEKIRTKADIIRAACKYIDRGVKYVLASMGPEGAIITDGTTSWFCKSASVAVNSTVGSGDSMVAAASVAFSKGAPIDELLRQAVAAGTAAVTTSGTNLFYKDKYEEIYAKVHAVKI
ncbi:MAG: hexose kinase [Clostridia bacterium]|nr:hexose kinase [Clostridia bacterium]